VASAVFPDDDPACADLSKLAAALRMWRTAASPAPHRTRARAVADAATRMSRRHVLLGCRRGRWPRVTRASLAREARSRATDACDCSDDPSRRARRASLSRSSNWCGSRLLWTPWTR
jgi:hypothetical protein